MSWQTFPQNFFIVYPIGKDPEHGGQNAAKIFFFWFLQPFIIYLSGFVFFSLSNFSKISSMDSLDILSLENP